MHLTPLAALAGMLSFLSPCVFPLLPAYLSYMTGADLQVGGRSGTGAAVARAAAFAAGLTIALMLMGATASLAGQWLQAHQTAVVRVGGAVVVLFGLHMAGWLRIPALYRERRVDLTRFAGRGAGGALLMGACFGVGWTPCIGPMLGAILLLASQEQTLWQGTLLLAVYGLGLGLPFVLAALLLHRALGFAGWMRRYTGRIAVVSGCLLMAMGLLLMTDQMTQLSAWFQRTLGPGLKL